MSDYAKVLIVALVVTGFAIASGVIAEASAEDEKIKSLERAILRQEDEVRRLQSIASSCDELVAVLVENCEVKQ